MVAMSNSVNWDSINDRGCWVNVAATGGVIYTSGHERMRACMRVRVSDQDDVFEGFENSENLNFEAGDQPSFYFSHR